MQYALIGVVILSAWGWTPDTFIAIGTVGTLATTTWLLAREANDRIRAQAKQVEAWTDWVYENPDERSDYRRFLFVHNASSNVIANVVVRYKGGSGENSNTMPPMKKIQYGLLGDIQGATLSFTDAAGRRWRRTIDSGTLRRVRFEGWMSRHHWLRLHLFRR
jgi:hypothetical protein